MPVYIIIIFSSESFFPVYNFFNLFLHLYIFFIVLSIGCFLLVLFIYFHVKLLEVQSQIIQTCYVRSHDQLADVFTKSLTSAHFHRLLAKLGSINPLDPA